MWKSDAPTGPEYVPGMDRSPEGKYMRSHLYLLHDGDYEPMCPWAWNRDDGFAFSIWRGHIGSRGICRICKKRAQQKLRGVPPKERKTRYA